jgi:hypothetical protein
MLGGLLVDAAGNGDHPSWLPHASRKAPVGLWPWHDLVMAAGREQSRHHLLCRWQRFSEMLTDGGKFCWTTSQRQQSRLDSSRAWRGGMVAREHLMICLPGPKAADPRINFDAWLLVFSPLKAFSSLFLAAGPRMRWRSWHALRKQS